MLGSFDPRCWWGILGVRLYTPKRYWICESALKGEVSTGDRMIRPMVVYIRSKVMGLEITQE